MQKINREEIQEARQVVELTQWDDNHPAWNAFLRKYGCQPHHSFEKAAAILLKITDPEFVPSDKMREAALNTLVGGHKEWFRAMIKEIVE